MDTLTLIIIVAIVISLIVFVVSNRNKFQALKNEVQAQQSDIGTYIEQKNKYLKDAMGITKVAYSKEVDGIKDLTSNDQFEHLMALGQKFPQLGNMDNYNQIIKKLSSLERDIAASKSLLNGNIKIYNQEIAMFPGLIVASIFGYKRESFIDEENTALNKTIDREEVDFSKY